jgi:hypothetical protein
MVKAKPIIAPTEAFPLVWPDSAPRTPYPIRPKFGSRTYAECLKLVRKELKLLNAKSIVISTNLPLRNDGEPMASAQVRGGDHGAAVYWVRNEKRAGQWIDTPYVMPCDKWLRLDYNLYAIALSIKATRDLIRWGAVTLEQAFAGFAALPAGDGTEVGVVDVPPRPWRDVLEVPVDGWVLGAPKSAVRAFAKEQYRRLAAQHHPDRGGVATAAAEINAAWEAAQAELEGS